MPAIPLKIASGTVRQLVSNETLSADGVEPRSGPVLTLGGAGTTDLRIDQAGSSASILVGPSNPSNAAIPAVEGSLYLRPTPDAGQLWLKTLTSPQVQWTQIAGLNVVGPLLTSVSADLYPTNSALLMDTASGPTSVVLPFPEKDLYYVVKDSSGNADVNPITIKPQGSLIDGQSAYDIDTKFGVARLGCNGNFWWKL